MTANLAILGCGRQGRVHANAITAIGAPSRLHSVYDPVRSAAESLSRSHPHLPKVSHSIESILADEEVHGVIIVTPNDTHAPLVLQVAKAGKSVLCEKPLDKDLGKLLKLQKELYDLGKTRKLPYMAVGFPKRHDPSFLALKAQLDASVYGQLEHLIIHSRDEAPQPTAYMAQSGGQLTDTCVHDFDLARLLMGDDDVPATIFTHGSIVFKPDACEEAKDTTRVTITVQTVKGRLLTIMNARHCPSGNDQRVEAHCEFGDIYISNPTRNDLLLITADEKQSGARPPIKSQTAERYQEAFLNQMRELVAAIMGGGGPLPPSVQKGSSIEDGVWASRAVEAAQESLRTGQAVTIRV
ncbi:NAD(P)-binding protein [Meredithblackwellia eburnea MCA 4105]